MLSGDVKLLKAGCADFAPFSWRLLQTPALSVYMITAVRTLEAARRLYAWRVFYGRAAAAGELIGWG